MRDHQSESNLNSLVYYNSHCDMFNMQYKALNEGYNLVNVPTYQQMIDSLEARKQKHTRSWISAVFMHISGTWIFNITCETRDMPLTIIVTIFKFWANLLKQNLYG